MLLWMFSWTLASAETLPESKESVSPPSKSTVETESSESSESTWPSKIPPLIIRSSDDTHRLRLALVAQMHYQMDGVESEPGEGRDYSHLFRWRRLRLDLRGSVLPAKLDYRVHMNVSPGSLELMDMYLNYRPYAIVPVSFGTAESTVYPSSAKFSFTNLQFVDWSVVSPWFGG